MTDKLGIARSNLRTKNFNLYFIKFIYNREIKSKGVL